MKFLVIGNGGREHAIAWKLAQSSLTEKVYCAPGNGGTSLEDKCENKNITSSSELIKFAKENNIDITVVGPEAPLVDGIVDDFKAQGLKIFGPAKAAARLEGSKSYSKEFCKKYGVKTAEYESFEDFDKAVEYLKACSYPVVVKADGLAAGKGVAICKTLEEAKEAVSSFMVKDIFKGAGKKIIIEEFLEGVEASILAITDGNAIIPLLSAKDHKTIYENNEGPNTGGMGAISPNPYCTEEVLKSFKEDIMLPTLEGIKGEEMDYVGIVFFGLMITKKGGYLLEYNVRMGDPETEAVLPLMESDFAELIVKAVDKKLDTYKMQWKNKHCCSIVAASAGYPGAYETGLVIKGFENLDSKVFAAGAKTHKGELVTAGGRVLAVSAIGDTLEQARVNAYRDIKSIDFDGIYYRSDIGKVE